MIKIAYLTVDDPKDYLSWSGLKLNMYKTLLSIGCKVDFIGPLKNFRRAPYVILREILNNFNIKYDSERKILLSKYYAKKIEKKLSKKKYDLIFTSDTYLVSYLKTDLPIILWLDVTYKTYFQHYFSKNKKHKSSFLEANKLEERSLKRSNEIILTSKWASNEAIKNYALSSKKIKVIPFGSNINHSFINKKSNKKRNYSVCNLISVGVDWKRKGMDKSIEVVKEMNLMGLKTNLTIVGAKTKKKLPNYVNMTGFLNKNNLIDRKKLIKIYQYSDFHILLSSYEACGVVFSEASSFGLFNITHDVGGISGVVKNNENGHRFKTVSNCKTIAKYIIKKFRNNKDFIKSRINSKKYFDKYLDWNVNSKILKKLILKNISKR